MAISSGVRKPTFPGVLISAAIATAGIFINSLLLSEPVFNLSLWLAFFTGAIAGDMNINAFRNMRHFVIVVVCVLGASFIGAFIESNLF